VWVRTAREEDLQAVHALLAETWHSTFDSVMGEGTVASVIETQFSISSLREKLKRPYSEFVVADSGDGTLHGMAFASQTDDSVATLSDLFVRPTEQVQGLGTMLLAEVEMAFPGVQVMRLDVVERQTEAVSFFNRKGYVAVGRGTDWGAANCDEPKLIMEKSLETWDL